MITMKRLLLAGIAALSIGSARAADPAVSHHDAAAARTTPINPQTVDMLLMGLGLMRQKEAGYLEFTNTKLSDPRPTTDLIVKQLRDGLRAAKNPQEITDVRDFCTASIESVSFAERNLLMGQAIDLLRSGRLPETNATLTKVNDLSDMDQHLSDLICKTGRG
jgi:hypothetical protein